MLHVIHDPSQYLLDFVTRFPDAAQNDGSLAQLLFGEVAIGEREVGSVEKVTLGVFVDAELDTLFFLHEERTAPREERENGRHW